MATIHRPLKCNELVDTIKTKGIEEAKELIKSTRDFTGALIQACICYCMPIVKYLLEECNTRSINRGLITACYYGHLDLVKYLIEEHKANDISSGMGHACSGGRIDVIKYLIAEHKVTSFNRGLDDAVWSGALNVVKYLIEECGADDYEQAWSSSCAGGHMKIVNYLLERCKGTPYINALCPDRGLIAACRDDKLDIVKRMIELKASVTAIVFTQACSYNSINIVKYLVDTHGIKDYWPGYCLAHIYNQYSVMKYLLELDEKCRTLQLENYEICMLLNKGLKRKFLNDTSREFIVLYDERNKAIREILLSNTNVNDDVICIVCDYMEYTTEF